MKGFYTKLVRIDLTSRIVSTEEISGQIAADSIEGKAKLLIDYEDRATLFDSLPKRFFTPLTDSGKVLKEEELVFMVQDYYKYRGWNEKGVPERQI